MKILAIDTSNRPLSVAILEDKRLLAETTTNVLRNHSTTLMPIVEDLLKKAATTIQEIDRFVVAKGPGSYTGLRIGVTTAKTFAFTLNKELVGVSSLKVLAANYKNTNRIIVPLFDARRQNVFAGVYRWENGELVNVMPDGHISLEKLQEKLKGNEIVFVGEDAIKLEKEISDYLNNKHINGIKLKGYSKNLSIIRKNYDLALICSEMEALGRVTIEARYYRNLVLCANRGGTVELVKNEKNGFLYDVNDIGDLEKKIIDIITLSKEDNNKINKIIGNAQKYAISNFSQNIAPQIIDFIKKVI